MAKPMELAGKKIRKKVSELLSILKKAEAAEKAAAKRTRAKAAAAKKREKGSK